MACTIITQCLREACEDGRRDQATGVVAIMATCAPTIDVRVVVVGVRRVLTALAERNVGGL